MEKGGDSFKVEIMDYVWRDREDDRFRKEGGWDFIK